MQIREAAADDLEHVNAARDASGRPHWTNEMIAPGHIRLVLVAVMKGEVVGAVKTHYHSDPDGMAPAGHYLAGVVVAPRFRRR
ncbi:hypothetical protein [Arthrobacter sp. R4-81]